MEFYFKYLAETHHHARIHSAFYYDQWFRYLTSPRGRILEIGSGTGPFLGYCLDTYGEVVWGTDLNPHCVAFVEQDPQLKIVQMNVLNLQYHIKVFSGVLCAHVLEHIEPDRRLEAVEEIWRVLQPGGKAIFVVPRPRPLWRFWDDLTHVSPVTQKQLGDLLGEVGFEYYFKDAYLTFFKWMRIRPELWGVYRFLLRLIPFRFPIAITAYAEKRKYE